MTTSASKILRRRYFKDNTGAEGVIQEHRKNEQIAHDIYELRTRAGLTQQQLAELIGTSAPTISRLEDADYRGHSLSMLQRIAAALGSTVQVVFVPQAAVEIEPQSDSTSPAAASGTRDQSI